MCAHYILGQHVKKAQVQFKDQDVLNSEADILKYIIHAEFTLFFYF